MLMGEAKSAVEFMRRWPRRKRETKRSRAKMRPLRQVFPQFNIMSVPVAQCVNLKLLLLIGVLLSILNFEGGSREYSGVHEKVAKAKKRDKQKPSEDEAPEASIPSIQYCFHISCPVCHCKTSAIHRCSAVYFEF